MHSILTQILPRSSLSEYIRKYEVFRFVFDKNTLPPPKYYPPRPEHCITFYVRDAQKFSLIDSLVVHTYPKAIVVGLHDIPLYRYGGCDFWAIKVVLQPTALYRLTGLPPQELHNTYADAQAIWGKEIRLVNERLSSTDSLKEMINIIESYLEIITQKPHKYNHLVDQAGSLILNLDNRQTIDHLARQCYLSTRQFSRKFEERIGVSPKMFYRISHFDKTYRLKIEKPNLDWLSIAIECDYYDYQHLVKDYKDFTHLTPPSFYEQDQKGPDHILLKTT